MDLTLFLLIFCTLLAKVTSQITDKTQYFIGDTFNITCDVTKFSGIPETDYLMSLSLAKKALTDTSFSNIAVYQPFAPPNYKTVYTLPSGRQWVFQFSGGDGSNNRQTIKIIVTVVYFRCDDAGLYKCLAKLPNDYEYETTAVNLTAKAQITQDDINMSPHNGADQYFSRNEYGDNINLTCTFEGPKNLQAVWKFSSQFSPFEQSYPNSDDIVDAEPEVTTFSVCSFSSYKSTLSFQMQEENDGNTYYCIVMDNGIEQSRANFSVWLYKNSVLPSPVLKFIFEKEHHSVGENVSIVCELHDPGNLDTLSIMRQTLTETTFTTLVSKQLFNVSAEMIFNIPNGKLWAARYTGYNNYTLTLTIYNYQCDDAGLYKCRATSHDDSSLNETSPVNLTVRAQTQLYPINMTPHNGNEELHSNNKAGETISLKTQFSGPPDLQAVWKFTKNGSTSQVNYPNLGDVTNTTSATKATGGCLINSYESVLKFRLNESDDGNTYYFIVLDNNVEQRRANYSISVAPAKNSSVDGIHLHFSVLCATFLCFCRVLIHK